MSPCHSFHRFHRALEISGITNRLTVLSTRNSLCLQAQRQYPIPEEPTYTRKTNQPDYVDIS